MKKTLLALCIVFTASQVFAALPSRRGGGGTTPPTPNPVNQPVAQPVSGSGLPNQLPAIEPPADPPSDHGVYSVQDQTTSFIGSGPFRDDPLRAAAFDNFTLGDAYNLTGLMWVGIYSEAIPGGEGSNPSDTDFIITIFGDDGGAPDLSDVVMMWTREGGDSPGEGGADLTVTPNDDVSPNTPTTEGGGPGFDYATDITGTLGPGSFWISIIADQTFESPEPIFDPEWQWHAGTGPGDGFYFEDMATGQDLTNANTDGKDLAFQLKGEIVPEPSSLILSLVGFVALGMLRRNRR